MITQIEIRSLGELQKLLYDVKQLTSDAFIHSYQQGVYTMTDAKDSDTVLALDFSQPVSLVSENQWIHKQMRRFAVRIVPQVQNEQFAAPQRTQMNPKPIT